MTLEELDPGSSMHFFLETVIMSSLTTHGWGAAPKLNIDRIWPIASSDMTKGAYRLQQRELQSLEVEKLQGLVNPPTTILLLGPRVKMSNMKQAFLGPSRPGPGPEIIL